MRSKLPIGIQSFESLRSDGYVYIDKTAYVYKLVHEGKPYFLSRPRRFGKSLLVSVLRAYWEGRKDLFTGLDIERLEQNNPSAWQPHPVFLFDFNGWSYKSTSLEEVLDAHLRVWEAQYGTDYQTYTEGERFQRLLEAAHAKTGKRCVVLVDEYDKSLLEVMDNAEKLDHNRAFFKGFFGTLKKCDDHLRFVFITGVTKFSKVSIVSDLNQLNDISLSKEYAGIVGVTEAELHRYFADDINLMAQSLGMSLDDCKQTLRHMYDGYRFHYAGENVYNPFSLLNALRNYDFGSYWFESGTPTFLISRMQKANFDPARLDDGKLWATEAQLSDYRADSTEVVPLMYQSGYVTIADYDARRRRYTLRVPNDEVKYGLLENLMPAYTPAATASSGIDIFTLDNYFEHGDTDGIRDVITALFASIPYTQEADPFEHYFQAVLYIVFSLLGRFVQCEVHTALGRVDCIVRTDQYIYVFEFKRDGSTVEALSQIEEKGYATLFAADARTIIKIAAIFDSQTRQLVDWAVV